LTRMDTLLQKAVHDEAIAACEATVRSRTARTAAARNQTVDFEQEVLTQVFDRGWTVRKFTCQISPLRCEQFSLREPGDNLAVVTLVRDRLAIMRFWFHYATPSGMRRELTLANQSGLLQLLGHHDATIRAYLASGKRNPETLAKIDSELARLPYRLQRPGFTLP